MPAGSSSCASGEDATGRLPERVLVTGSGGFIGPHLVSALRRAGTDVHEVRGRADCDLSDATAAYERVAEVAPDVVIHLAASPDDSRPAAAAARNTLASAVNVVRSVQRVPNRCRIVHAGSYKQYGSVARPFREHLPAKPDSAYGRAKHRAESVVRAAENDRISTVCLRFGPIFGPGQDVTRLVPRLIRHTQSPFPDLGFASVPWDPLYVSDAVAGLVGSMWLPAAAGRIVNLSGGRAYLPSEIARMVAEEVGAARPSWPEGGLDFGGAAASHGDIGVARGVLGWRPEVGIREGIRSTIRAMGIQASDSTVGARREVAYG